MKKIHIVSHTHWDREWYRSYEYFRDKLVFVIDSLLSILENDSSYKHFLLDGQTSILEDYLEIKAENTEKIKSFINTDRISVGPLYIQPDEFAPDGESLIRNLQLGIGIAEKFGKSMMIGYFPDSFGHTGQLPQILQGFGIDSAVITRGVPAHKIQSSEFIWEGLNGDTVFAILLPQSYSNALFMPEDFGKFKLRLSLAIQQLKKWASTDNFLIMNGVDHQFPQKFIGEYIKRLNATQKNKIYLHSTLQDYIADIRKGKSEFPQYEGELISPVLHRVHTSIASTRIYQKQKNRQLETFLENFTEPIATIAWLHGADYPQGLIKQAWKYLIQNQTHDGICGCCVDEVHKEMDLRFAKTETICKTITNSTSRAVAKRVSSNQLALIIFNSAMTQGNQLVHATIYVKNESFTIEDLEGNNIPFQIEHCETADVSQLNFWSSSLGLKEIVKKIDICFSTYFDFNLGYRMFKINEKGHPKEEQSEFIVNGNTIENKYFIMKICENGSFDLYDKTLQMQFHNLHLFEDCGDAGDSYNYSPVKKDTVISSEKASASYKIEQNGMQQITINIELTLNLPKSLLPDGSARSLEETTLPIKTKITLYSNIRRIDFKTQIENNVYDHRLRVLFPTGIHSDFSYAETQFGTVKRQNKIENENWEKEGWKEKPLPIYSQQKFVELNDGGKGFAVLNCDLTEYEIYDNSTIAITLLRCVGFMGKKDLLIRPGRCSGIPIPTPDAQCVGIHEYAYAILPYAGDISESPAPHSAAIFHALPLAVQNEIWPKKVLSKDKIISQFGSMETITSYIRDQLNEMPADFKLLIIKPRDILISAFKKAEDEQAFIVRIYNPNNKLIKNISLHFGTDIKEGYLTDFNEKELGKLGQGDNRTFLLPELKPFTAATMKIFPKLFVV